MEPQLNPYNPGSGVPPRFLAGRDPEIRAFDLLVARTELSMPARPMVLSGLRGVGKTVLLNRLKGIADHHGWLTVKLEGRPGDGGACDIRRASRSPELQVASRRYVSQIGAAPVKRLLGTVTSFSTTIGIDGISLGVDVDPARASTGHMDIDLQDVVEDVGQALRTLRKGFAVFIDEMQDVDDELLAALVTVQHHAVQNELPFFVTGAGLPNLPARLADARSYAERLFDYRQIGKLDHDQAAESLTVPADQMGQSYSDAALAAVLEASGRYPYFIQEFGSAMWEVATTSPFTGDEAQEAVRVGQQRLDAGFFPSRWDRATPRERDYMNAMAADGDGPTATGAIAARLGKKVTSLGPTRAQLIAKGLIYPPEYGKVAFTVPGMAEFIARQYQELGGEMST
ncbi:ATPase [Sinomonas cyclohexanicum]|uniref:ATPase n=1 Tax=Sinomonas cyclohexanicum TaxID=322009 RepID=A0ABM7Q0I6_SINCY|nr:ATP-binding protein [Corynebacterium cyclohexanicum]BCT78074.1 ATPase [Corynebacterium cyclohexanicum]